MLALGFIAGGLAVASLQRVVPPALAGNDPAQMKPIAGISTESLATLRSLDSSMASLADYLKPSVVHIMSESKGGGTDMLGRRIGASMGEGTGIVYRADGWILTNDHVVNGFDKVTVILSDGHEYPGKVTRAEDSDLAVVKIDANNLPAAQFGDSSKVRPGQFAMAVGAPFGLDNTVTVGHISALDRSSTIADERSSLGQRYYPDLIQTDASINMGNSGGPLVNVEGQVIGVNSAIIGNPSGSMLGGGGGSVGIGFAIPSNEARMIADMLIDKGKVTRAALGLIPDNLKEYELKDLNIAGGARVKDIPPYGPAAKAGIQKDDIVVKVGTYPIKNQMDVRDAMLHYSPGATIPVEVIRSNSHKTIDVKTIDSKELMALQQKNMPKMERPQAGNSDGDMFDSPEIRKFFDDQGSPRSGQPHTGGQAHLGVGIDNITDVNRKQFHIPAGVDGVVVGSVDPGSVADQNGIQVGTVIQQIGGKQIKSAKDVTDAMSSLKWGDKTHIKGVRYIENGKVSLDMDLIFR